MNRTQIAMLLAVLGMATFYLQSKIKKVETTTAKTEAARYYPGKGEADIESISVVCTDPNFAYVLRRNGDRWYLDGHLASQEKSPQLVMSIIEMGTERDIQATPGPDDDKEYGFDEPTYTIGVTANGGKDLGTVLLGNRAPSGNHFYGRWQKGGPIALVPTMLFSVLEEEPKDLRENSPFPVSASAVNRFEYTSGKEKGKLERPEGKEEGLEFTEPVKKPADESRVVELIHLLKDMKVARLLDDKEKTDMGAPVVNFRAHEGESTVDIVVELCGPVAVNPKLRYGRRYLTDPGKAEPRPGTEERFVIEILPDSKALQASQSIFEDRRLAKLNVDKVKVARMTLPGGEKLAVERQPQGGWKFLEPESRVDQPDPGQKVDRLLWAIRDLRFSPGGGETTSSEQGAWRVRLEMSGSEDLEFGFGRDKSGKPLVGFGNKTVLLQEDGVPALDDAALGLSAKAVTSTSTPTPQGP